MTDVELRHVTEDDVEIFFEHQRDPASVEMSAFAPRDHEAHVTHWRKVMSDPACITRTIVAGGVIAGNLGSWVQDETRELGYVLGKEFWGRGIATKAVAAFLDELGERPIVAWVATHNLGSIRVLEKCGFVESRREKDERGVEYVVMILAEARS